MKPIAFKLRGKIYHVSDVDVREALLGVEPLPLEKYYIEVGVIQYPPKQAVARAFKLPILNFTTMDANRILSKLGFKIYQAEPKIPTERLRDPEERLTSAIERMAPYSGLTYDQKLEIIRIGLRYMLKLLSKEQADKLVWEVWNALRAEQEQDKSKEI